MHVSSVLCMLLGGISIYLVVPTFERHVWTNCHALCTNYQIYSLRLQRATLDQRRIFMYPSYPSEMFISVGATDGATRCPHNHPSWHFGGSRDRGRWWILPPQCSGGHPAVVHGSSGSVEQNRFLGVQYRLEGCRGVFPYYGYVRLQSAVLQRPG